MTLFLYQPLDNFVVDTLYGILVIESIVIGYMLFKSICNCCFNKRNDTYTKKMAYQYIRINLIGFAIICIIWGIHLIFCLFK